MKNVVLFILAIFMIFTPANAGIKKDIQNTSKVLMKNLFVRPLYIGDDFYTLTGMKPKPQSDSVWTKPTATMLYIAKFRPENKGNGRQLVTEEARIYYRDTLNVLHEYSDTSEDKQTLIRYIEEAYPSAKGWTWINKGPNRCMRIYVPDNQATNDKFEKKLKKMKEKEFDNKAVWHPLEEYCRPVPGTNVLVKIENARKDMCPLLLTIVWDENVPPEEFAVKACADGTFTWSVGSRHILAWAYIDTILSL